MGNSETTTNNIDNSSALDGWELMKQSQRLLFEHEIRFEESRRKRIENRRISHWFSRKPWAEETKIVAECNLALQQYLISIFTLDLKIAVVFEGIDNLEKWVSNLNKTATYLVEHPDEAKNWERWMDDYHRTTVYLLKDLHTLQSLVKEIKKEQEETIPNK